MNTYGKVMTDSKRQAKLQRWFCKHHSPSYKQLELNGGLWGSGFL